MKIMTGEVKPFEINEAMIDRAQFETLATALGSFDKAENKENGVGLVKFANGTQVLFVKDNETGIRAAYAITEKEVKARLVTGVEVTDGKIVLTRDGKQGAKSEITGDEVVVAKKVADEKKAALDKANGELAALNEDLEGIKGIQTTVEELSVRLDGALNVQADAKKAHEDAAAKLVEAAAAEKAAAEALEAANAALAAAQKAEGDARENYNAAVEAHIPAGEAQKAWEGARKDLRTATAEQYNANKAHEAAQKVLEAAQKVEGSTKGALDKADEDLKAVEGEVKALIAQNKYAKEFFELATIEEREGYFAKLIETREGEIATATTVRDEAAKVYGQTFVGAINGVVKQPKFKALKYALTGRGFVHGIYEVAVDGKKCDKGLLVVAPADNIVWQRGKLGDTTNNTVKTYFIPNVTKDEMEVALLTVESAEELFELGARAVKPRGGIQITPYAHNGNEITCYSGSQKNEKGEYTSDKREIYKIVDKNQVLEIVNGVDETYQDEEGHEATRKVGGMRQIYARTSTPFEVLNHSTSKIKNPVVAKVAKVGLIALIGAVILGGAAFGTYKAVKAFNDQGNAAQTIIDDQEQTITDQDEENAKLLHGRQVDNITDNEIGNAQDHGVAQADQNRLNVHTKGGEIVVNNNTNLANLPLYQHTSPAIYSIDGTIGTVVLTAEDQLTLATRYGYEAAQFDAYSYEAGCNYVLDLLPEAVANGVSISAYNADGDLILAQRYLNLGVAAYGDQARFNKTSFEAGANATVKEQGKAGAQGIEVETYDRTQEMENMGIDSIIAGEDGKFYVIDDGVLTEYVAEEGYEYTNDTVTLEDVFAHAAEGGAFAQSTYAKNVYATTSSVEGNSKATLVEYRAIENDAVREGEAVVVRKSGSTTDMALATAVAYAQDAETIAAGYGDIDLPRDSRNYTVYSSIEAYETVYGDNGANLN